MSFPRYGSYKSSGVESLGAVPEHWAVELAKRFVTVQSGDMISADEETEDGFPIIGGNGIRARTQKWNTAADTLVVGRVGAKCGCVHHVREKFWASEHAFRVIERKQLSRRFFFYLLSTLDLNRFAIRTAQPLLNTDIVETQWVPAPPIPEQDAIASFLDRETAKIDALVAEQRRLMELLNEKRQAVISHAVTKGLNPHASMKDSGIEWLGEVPTHWDFASLKRIASRVVVGIAEAATHAYADEGIPILRSTNIRAGRIVGDVLLVDSSFADDRASKRINAGDLVTVRTGNAGVTAVIPQELDGCQCFTMLITTLNQGSLADYYCYWMNGVSAQCYFTLEGWGTAQVNISVPILKALPVPVPPSSEQQEIVAYLDRETSKLDKLSVDAERTIDLLQERRSALIAAAVTGQIDVRGLEEQEAA